MPTREARSLPDSQRQRKIQVHTDFAVKSKTCLADSEPASKLKIPLPIIDAPTRTLSPLSFNDMNSLNGYKAASTEHINTMRTTNGANGTIRSVPSDSQQLDLGYEEDSPRRPISKPDSSMPHSTSLPQISGSRAAPPLAWQNSKIGGIGNVVRKMSSEFGPTKLYTGGIHVVENGPPSTNDSTSQGSGANDGRCTCGHVCGQGNEGGKSTSKFIERVMSERDSYKRELAAERLKFKEVNDTLDFAKARMDKTISEHESEMHDATINKTLLKRKERQLEDMKAKIEVEKQRAEGAMEQEKVWKSEMDTVRAESRQKVEAAEDYAAMMEAQINTMSRHWKDKQADLDKQEAKAKKLITDVLDLLRTEAEKTKRLEEICDQYRAENERLSMLNQAAFDTHEEYKIVTEESLKDMKTLGAKIQKKGNFYLDQAVELRDKLKWSLNVSKDFKDLPSAVDNLKD